MNYMFVINESYTNGFKIGFLDLFSLIAIVSAIMVIISKNPVVSALYLISLFFAISCYLMSLGINYIGLSYLLVYVGAVSILFLFILMLINVRISELVNAASNSIPLAILVVIAFSFCVHDILPFNNTMYLNLIPSYILSILLKVNSYFSFFQKYSEFSDINEIQYVTGRVWDGNLSEASHITSIGNVMYSSHSMWLIITSVILLLAMVGAIVITIKQK